MKFLTMLLLFLIIPIIPLEIITPVDNMIEKEFINLPKLASKEWTENELANFTNVRDQGVKGDGISNDTASLQLILNNKKNIYFPDGIYLIDVERALNLSSNQTIFLSENAILKAIPSKKGYSAVLRLTNVSNVHISGGQIIGERYLHQGNSGEWGMGIQIIEGSHHISVHQVRISDCWGDGIFLGDSPRVSDILIEDVICDNNRRQGLSITDARRITVRDSVFMNTNGTLPEAGIDIEPDSGQTSEDIQIINVDCFNNKGSGLDLMGITGQIDNILVKDSRFIENKGPGIRFFDVAGEVELRNLQIKNNCDECPDRINRNNLQRFRQIIEMIFDKI